MNCDYIVLWFRYFSKTLFLKILFEAYMNWSSWMYWYKVQWLKALKWIFNYKFVDLSINESHRHWHSINVDETTVWWMINVISTYKAHAAAQIGADIPMVSRAVAEAHTMLQDPAERAVPWLANQCLIESTAWWTDI